MKLRSLAIGLTLLTAGSVVGVTTQQFASAEISSGDRPVLVPIEPCRLVDTRPGDATVGPRSSPLGAADTLTVDAQGPDTECTGALPADALSLSLNVTAVGATGQTFLTIWAGGDRPDASSLNPAPGAPPTPNAVTVDLSVDQTFEIYNNLGTVNIIVDINGYYEHHNHDDLYYPRADVDALVAPTTTTHTYAVPASAFQSRDSDSSTITISDSLWDAKTYVNSSGAELGLSAPVYLPDGATVVSVRFRYIDSTADNMTLRLQRRAGINSMTMAQRTTSGSQLSSRTVTDDTIAQPIVDNSSGALVVTAFRPDWASLATADDTAIGDVTITYTLTE